MRATVVLLLALCWLAACSRDKGVAPVEPEVSYTLTISASSGVVSTPPAGTYKHEAGAVLSYEFRLSGGHRNLVVEMGKSLVPHSGQVRMTGDIALFASAEPVPAAPPGSEPVVESASEYLSAPDSASAVALYSEHVQRLEELYTSDPKQALSLALAGNRSALEQVGDHERERVERFLSGQIIGSAQAGLSYDLEGASPAALIYVNGIWNSAGDAAVSRLELSKAVQEAGLTDKLDVYGFYNASFWHEPDGTKKCLRRSVELTSYAALLKCNLPIGDLTELGRQVADLAGWWKGSAEPEALALAEVIENELARGRPVILVGHSQGNLMIAQALRSLASSKCVGVVSLASPLGRASWEPFESPALNGLVVAGEKTKDIVLYLGQNDLPQVATDISRRADQDVSNLTGLSPTAATAYKIFADYRLHAMAGSYMSGAESRVRARELISEQLARLESEPECAGQPAGRMYATSGSFLGPFASPPSDLWIVPPTANGVDTLVARIKTASGEEIVMTDIARAPSGALWGISFDALYRIDTSTAVASMSMSLLGAISGANALAFDAQGRLYVAGTNGQVAGIELEPLRVFWTGDFGPSYSSSGDLAFSPEGTLYAVVKKGGKDYLAKVDLQSGAATALGPEPIGFDEVWGLNFFGNKLFGLTSDAASGKGLLIAIDTETGKGELVRQLSFNAFGASIRSR